MYYYLVLIKRKLKFKNIHSLVKITYLASSRSSRTSVWLITDLLHL